MYYRDNMVRYRDTQNYSHCSGDYVTSKCMTSAIETEQNNIIIEVGGLFLTLSEIPQIATKQALFITMETLHEQYPGTSLQIFQ